MRSHLVGSVQQNEDKVEAREQRLTHAQVLRHSLGAVVVSAGRVGSGQDGGASW